MNRNLSICIILLAFFVGIGIANIAYSDSPIVKIGYVKVDKLLSNSKTLKEAQLKRGADTKEMLEWYDSKRDEILAQQNEKERAALIKKYETQLTAKKKAINSAYAQKLNVIENQIQGVINAKAKELGYDLVFDYNAILKGGDDLTDKMAPFVQ